MPSSMQTPNPSGLSPWSKPLQVSKVWSVLLLSSSADRHVRSTPVRFHPVTSSCADAAAALRESRNEGVVRPT